MISKSVPETMVSSICRRLVNVSLRGTASLCYYKLRGKVALNKLIVFVVALLLLPSCMVASQITLLDPGELWSSKVSFLNLPIRSDHPHPNRNHKQKEK